MDFVKNPKDAVGFSFTEFIRFILEFRATRNQFPCENPIALKETKIILEKMFDCG